MSEYKVPCVPAQSVLIKVSTNKNAKPIETWNRWNYTSLNKYVNATISFKMAAKNMKQGNLVRNVAQEIKLFH